jgi:hypothetical protein
MGARWTQLGIMPYVVGSRDITGMASDCDTRPVTAFQLPQVMAA